MSSRANERFGLRNALSFLWHLRWGRSEHSDWISYDDTSGDVVCACGKRWP